MAVSQQDLTVFQGKTLFPLKSKPINPCLNKKLAHFLPRVFPAFITPFQLTACRVMVGLCTKVS